MQSNETLIPSFGLQQIINKLHNEIALLEEMLAKIDPGSQDPGDRWAIAIYRKIIKRREKLAECFQQ